MSIELVKHIYFKLPIIVRLLLGVFAFMTFFGIIIHYIEPGEFPTIFEGVWWAFVTGATIGFGDYAPKTVQGQIVGIILILTGGGLLTFYIATISASTIEHEQNLSKGKVAFKGHGHMIFIGWNERTRQLIELINNRNPLMDIVLIDRTLTHLPYKQYPVHFIHGDASEDTTLRQAKIEQAKNIVITGDHTIKQRQSDHYTILTTLAIRGNNKDAAIIAEMLTKEQIENAMRAGVSTVIRSNDFMSTLFYHELINETEAQPFHTIFHLLSSQFFHQLIVPEELYEKTFQEGMIYFMQQQNLLLGVIRNDKWLLNPGGEFILHKADIALTVSKG